MADHKREERESSHFVWFWIKDTKHVGPAGMVQIAQSFKHVGTFIPRYIVIKYHFHMEKK